MPESSNFQRVYSSSINSQRKERKRVKPNLSEELHEGSSFSKEEEDEVFRRYSRKYPVHFNKTGAPQSTSKSKTEKPTSFRSSYFQARQTPTVTNDSLTSNLILRGSCPLPPNTCPLPNHQAKAVSDSCEVINSIRGPQATPKPLDMWFFLAKKGKNMVGDIQAFQKRDQRLTSIHRKLTILSRIIFLQATICVILAVLDIEFQEVVFKQWLKSQLMTQAQRNLTNEPSFKVLYRINAIYAITFTAIRSIITLMTLINCVCIYLYYRTEVEALKARQSMISGSVWSSPMRVIFTLEIFINLIHIPPFIGSDYIWKEYQLVLLVRFYQVSIMIANSNDTCSPVTFLKF